jgi:hypothetical protein
LKIKTANKNPDVKENRKHTVNENQNHKNEKTMDI